MKLEIWLQKEGKTKEWLAKTLQVSKRSVYNYCYGKLPKPKVLKKITYLTAGEVQYYDFDIEY